MQLARIRVYSFSNIDDIEREQIENEQDDGQEFNQLQVYEDTIKFDRLRKSLFSRFRTRGNNKKTFSFENGRCYIFNPYKKGK